MGVWCLLQRGDKTSGSWTLWPCWRLSCRCMIACWCLTCRGRMVVMRRSRWLAHAHAHLLQQAGSSQRGSTSQTHHIQCARKSVLKSIHTFHYQQANAPKHIQGHLKPLRMKRLVKKQTLNLRGGKSRWNINENEILTSFFYWTLKFRECCVSAAVCSPHFELEAVLKIHYQLYNLSDETLN